MPRRLISLLAVLLVALAGVVPASAGPYQTGVVSSNPVDWTPHILEGEVRAIAVVGEYVVVGGDFSGVREACCAARYERIYLFAFNRRTGRVYAPFTPEVNGAVYSLAAGPDGTVYVGGMFRWVNGAAVRGLTQLRVSDGTRVPSFSASIDQGDVRTLATAGPWLYVGGTFGGLQGVRRTGLARLHTGTGKVDTAFDGQLEAPELHRVKVEDLAVSPDGRHLVTVGSIEWAGGEPRYQLAVFDVGAATPVVTDWDTDAFTEACRDGFDTYLRGVDFAPDGSYFVVVTTGRASAPDLMCDTASRFDLAGRGLHDPVWVNHTGGDSLYSVAVTGTAVYVGGHQRWLDNPEGEESPGPGAVERPGIGAIDPATGRAMSWNPTRDRGVGARALLATADGLFVGSDTDLMGGEYHGRLGLFPPD